MSAVLDAVIEKEVISPLTLVKMLKRNFGVIMAQVEGLTHEESLLQPPFRGNCLNWVIGHLVQSRDRMLRVAGEPTVWTAEQVARYERDSPAVTNDDDALRLEKMLADLATQQKRLTTKLQTITPDELDIIGIEAITGITNWRVGEWLHFLLWHETYHLGNLELLRQLSGKNDKVI